jgi:hypothetical protein
MFGFHYELPADATLALTALMFCHRPFNDVYDALAFEAALELVAVCS